MTYKNKGGKQYDLGGKIAGGGEGDIFPVIGDPSSVAKIYKAGKITPEKEAKLIRMVTYRPDKRVLSQIAWPSDVLYDTSDRFAGFIMPKLDINEDLNVIYEYGSSAKYQNITWMNKITIAVNLCAVLDAIHREGHVCGDLNPKNISVNPNTGLVVFLDTDSYHIQDGATTYRCNVGIPEYLPLEIQNKMRGGVNLATAQLPTFTQDTDNFALAVHIFQLLMNGAHPFACAVILAKQSSVTAPQPLDNILKGLFPYMQDTPGITIPRYSPKINVMTNELQNLFAKTFISGHQNPRARPDAENWYKALLKLRTQLRQCNKNNNHQYYNALSSCPWCEVNYPGIQKPPLVQIPITTPSDIKTIDYQNGGKYVGEVQNDKRNGQGTYTFASGNKYVGAWKDGKQNGQGTYTYANGDKYVGEFKDGLSHGQGTYTYANGDKYVGEWKDDLFHGQGTFTWPNGDEYVGEWRDDKRTGQGTLTKPNGEVWDQRWENGKLMSKIRR